MKALCAAMAKAFPEIEGATKDKNNPAFRSKYADLGSVVDAIKPALIKHDLFFAQNTHDVDGGVCVETFVYHSSGEGMSFGKLFVPATKQDAQGYGSALTYARRYSLMAAFGVAPEDDDGNAAAASAPKKQVSILDAPTTAPPSKPREKMDGPIATVAALKDVAGKIRDEVEAVADYDSLDAYLITMKAEIEQIKRYKSEWWNNPDYGLDGVIATAYRRIESEVGAANEPDWKRNPVLAG